MGARTKEMIAEARDLSAPANEIKMSWQFGKLAEQGRRQRGSELPRPLITASSGPAT
jgi:hypothetical protein